MNKARIETEQNKKMMEGECASGGNESALWYFYHVVFVWTSTLSVLLSMETSRWVVHRHLALFIIFIIQLIQSLSVKSLRYENSGTLSITHHRVHQFTSHKSVIPHPASIWSILSSWHNPRHQNFFPLIGTFCLGVAVLDFSFSISLRNPGLISPEWTGADLLPRSRINVSLSHSGIILGIILLRSLSILWLPGKPLVLRLDGRW